MFRRSTILLALAALAAAPSARADDEAEETGTPVVIVPFAPLFGDLPQSKADKASELFKAELLSLKRFRIVEPVESKKKAARSWEDDVAAAAAEIAEARKEFDAGNELIGKKKFPAAAKAYQSGIQRFLANFQGADSFEPLSEALLQLAIARIRQGQDEEYERTLADLVHADPARVLKAPDVKPVVVTKHTSIRTAILEKPRGQLKITSTPAGAHVFIDGRDVGETPLLAKGLLVGDHYVKVVKEGVGAMWKQVKVEAGEPGELRAELSGESGSLLAGIASSLLNNKLDDKVTRDAKKVGESSKADFVVFGALHKDDEAIEVGAYALKVKSGQVMRLAAATFNVEFLGARTEIDGLVDDFYRKTQDFAGAVVDEPMALFKDAKGAGSGDEKLNAVIVTGPGGAAGTPAVASGDAPAASSERRGRRAIASAVEEPKPAPAAEAPKAAAEAEKKPAAEQAAPAEEEAPKLRQRGRIGAKPAEPEARPEPVKKAEDEEPKVVRQEEKPKASLASIADDEEKPAEKKPEPEVDTRKGITTPSYSALSPEELARLQSVEKKDDDSSTGKILLWTGVGVGAAAIAATVGYFVLVPSTPTSAKATISWTP